MLTLYRLLWWLATPVLLVGTWLHPRTRVRWRERWGLRFPGIEPGAIVVHAASVGEGRAAEALLEALRSSRRVLLRTATSDTAFEAARGHHALAALPVDHPLVIDAWLRRVRPALLVLVEAEIWPNLVLMARDAGVPVLRVSARSGSGTRRLQGWMPEVFEAIEDLDPGPLKLAAALPEAPMQLPRPLLVAGSVRDGDTERLLDALDRMDEPPFLLLAPRHPERFDRSLLRGRERVHLLETVGQLAGFYRVADVAFVGGTYDAALGGHSPAEPLAAGVPVVHGPEIAANASLFSDRCVLAEDLAGALEVALSMGRVDVEAPGIDASEVLARALVEPPVERPYRPWLRPFVGLYLAWSRERGGPRVSLPVISVGALASGGSGKTPVVRHIVAELQAIGRRCAVLSRGHGRSEAVPLGDELTMMQGEVLVVASADRVAGVAEAARLGADVVVLDDGFHSAVDRDLDVLVLDAVHPLAGGLIPVGEARPGSLAEADIVWCTRGHAPIAHVHSHVVLGELPEGPVHAFAGIHRPGRFLEALVVAGVDVRGWSAFEDHHEFQPGEVVSPHPLVTTEKDAVRFDGEAHVVSMTLDVDSGGELLREKLRALFVVRVHA